MKSALLFCALLLTLFQSSLKAQHTHELGLLWMNDKDGLHTWAPGIGIQWVAGTGRFTSVETGIFYKIYAVAITGKGAFDQTVRTDNISRNLLVPVRYRVGHRWLRIQAGADFAFRLSSHLKESVIPVTNLDKINRTLTVRPLLGLCTPWKIHHQWTIEPGITASAPIPAGGVSWGLNLALRKKIK